MPSETILHYLTHPQVAIDPAVPVPDWGLSDRGRARVDRLAASDWVLGIGRIVSSAERKALVTAHPIAARLGLPVIVAPASHENDRSATGFLPPPEFETVADRFFAEPETSIRGWERAVDAQARVADAITEALAGIDAGRVLVVGHGGVGTLLWCRLRGLPIDRCHDQPAGGGNVWTLRWPDGEPEHGWRSMDEL